MDGTSSVSTIIHGDHYMFKKTTAFLFALGLGCGTAFAYPIEEVNACKRDCNDIYAHNPASVINACVKRCLDYGWNR